MQDSLTIIIPTLTNTKGIIYELKVLSKYPVVVVDNAPSKEKKLASQKHGCCTYLPQSQNQGFARAINLAFKYVRTSWICILNDDIEFPSKLPLPELIRLAKKNHWDAISPVLIKKSGEVENMGYHVLPIGRVKLVYDLRSTPHDLDGLTAACLVMKSEIFRKLGGFDTRFFAYLEDIDLFLRLKRAGFHFGIAVDFQVIHNHMTTSRKMGNFKSFMDLRNWCLLIYKHWTLKMYLQYGPQILLERLRNISGYLKVHTNG